jgi:hypothetical protein
MPSNREFFGMLGGAAAWSLAAHDAATSVDRFGRFAGLTPNLEVISGPSHARAMFCKSWRHHEQ